MYVSAVGTSEVEAQWFAPNQLNGVLERYQLYVSVDQSTVGELAYNNTGQFLIYVIPNLNAGTTYFIRAAVSSRFYFQTDSSWVEILKKTVCVKAQFLELFSTV